MANDEDGGLADRDWGKQPTEQEQSDEMFHGLRIRSNHKFVWINLGLAWMSIWRRAVSPVFTKRCGVFAGMTTITPAATSRCSAATVIMAEPSIVNAPATWGSVGKGGACPAWA